jgi:TolB protein
LRLLVQLLGLSLLVTACLPTGQDLASQSPLLAALERKSGLIAYVGVDGNIYTINQGGGNETAITSDADLPDPEDAAKNSRIYLFPTWSHDGRRLAFAGISGTTEAILQASIHTAAADGKDLAELFSSDFAQPIYLYWSPDSEHLTFLTSTEAGGLLLQMVSAQGGQAQILDEGQPFYWSWAPDGRRMLIHSGGNGANARLSFLFPQDEVIEELLDVRPALFQAPAWQPHGDSLLLSAEGNDGKNELMLLGAQGEVEASLAELGSGSAAFAWSPDGRKVAYLSSEIAQSLGALGPLKVVDLDKPEAMVTSDDEQVFAFFWSPNSERIAYFVPRQVPVSSDGGGEEGSENTVIVLGLYMLDVASGANERITVFQPTPQFLNVMPYFDQYHRSATIWSPDSKNVVISGYDGAGAPGILVIHASGDLEPRRIGDGTLAFWSWE